MVCSPKHRNHPSLRFARGGRKMKMLTSLACLSVQRGQAEAVDLNELPASERIELMMYTTCGYSKVLAPRLFLMKEEWRNMPIMMARGSHLRRLIMGSNRGYSNPTSFKMIITPSLTIPCFNLFTAYTYRKEMTDSSKNQIIYANNYIGTKKFTINGQFQGTGFRVGI